MVLLLGMVVARTHCGAARGDLGKYWAAGLARLLGEVQVGGGCMSRPSPSQEPRAQVGVPRHHRA